MSYGHRKEEEGRLIPAHRGDISTKPGQNSDKKYNPYTPVPVTPDDFHSRHPFSLKEELQDLTNLGKTRLAITVAYLAAILVPSPFYFYETYAIQEKLMLTLALIFLGFVASVGNLMRKGTIKS